MLTPHPSLLRPATAGRTVAVVGDVYRFLVTSQDTQGQYAIWEALVPPGGGPPPHTHSREEEGFWVVEGAITFHIEDRTVVATPGMFANMAPGTRHSFKNETDRLARMLILIAPAGLEEMFFETGVALPEGATTALPPTQAEIDRLLVAAPRYGVVIHAPAHGAPPT
jgi:quercetin dioxygenase-like cupin family protein